MRVLRKRPLSRSWLRAPFLYFGIAIVLVITFYPSLEGNRSILGMLVYLVMLAGVGAVGVRRQHLGIAAVLALPGLGETMAMAVLRSRPPDWMVQALLCGDVLFFSYVTIAVISRLLRDDVVTADTIAGSVCAFLLMGATW